MTKTLSGLYANGYVLVAAQSATLNPLTITGTILTGTNKLASATDCRTNTTFPAYEPVAVCAHERENVSVAELPAEIVIGFVPEYVIDALPVSTGTTWYE